MEKGDNYHFTDNKCPYPRLLMIPKLKLHNEKKLKKNEDYKYLLSANPTVSSVHANDWKNNLFFKPKLPKSFYITKLREWAEEIPIIGLQCEWEDNIMQLTCNNWIYPDAQRTSELLNEVRKLYITDMQQLAIQSTVVDHDKILNDKSCDIDTNDKYKIKNEFHKTIYFMKHRESLKNKYFLSHNVMMNIITISTEMLLPQTIVDFSYYHTIGLTSLMDIRNIIKRDLRNASSRIKKYHRQVADTILWSKPFLTIPPILVSQFIRCATNLFVQQILYIMMQSMKQMIQAIECHQHCIQIEFELILENGSLIIKPSIEEVMGMYDEVFCDIANIAQNLSLFKVHSINLHDNITNDECIRIKVPDWFITIFRNELNTIIINLFEPLHEYFRKIKHQFNYVCADETQKSIANLVNGNHNHDIYYEHVKKFHNYLNQGNEMVSFQYYRVGRLNQIQAKESIKRNVCNVIDILVDKLICYHMTFNESICQDFEKFRSKSLNIPNNTGALFALNENLILNSTNIVDSLAKKVQESVKMLITLLDITSLSKKHMELNSNTINCLSAVKDIFVQSNTLCEAMKSELEDELQKKINTLNSDIDNVFPKLIILNDMDDANRVHEYIEYLRVFVEDINQINCKIEAINTEERLFKFPETIFSKINDIKNIVLPFFSLNHMIHQWTRYYAIWMDGPFEYINPAEVERLISFYFDKFTQLNKSIKANVKTDMSSHKLFKFSGIIDDPDPMQQPAPMKLCFQALEQINECKQYIPLINCLCNSALKQRHWNEMSIIYGCDITPNAGTTLRKFIACNLMKNMEQYHKISMSANKELALQQQLKNMYEEWENVSFALRHDEMGRLIFVNFNEIQLRLEEHLIIIEEMKGSYFVKPIVDDVEEYHKCLKQVGDIINKFNIVQNECLFLRPIFTNNKICIGQLVNVVAIYFQVQKIADDLMENFNHQSKFHNIGQSHDILIKLINAMEKIEMVNNDVCIYLNNIRFFFPRFFFLSDNELVAILFEDDEVKRIKNLLRKCFQGVKNIKVNVKKMENVTIISDQNEEICLQTQFVYNNEDKNIWMKGFESAIINAVHKDIHNCMNNINMVNNKSLISLENFSLGITAECIIQLNWTSSIQSCFMKFHPEKMKLIFRTLNSLIKITINNLKSELLFKNRIILMNLATILLHQQEIINLLILKEVSDENNFNWIAQLRYYWQDKNVKVGIMYAIKEYGYEFSSITKPIVNTLLTDRCYRTIIEAGQHQFFTTLLGHTATGKTETIRGITRALAVPFHIIHCSENLGCKQISQILKGLITCGAWVCFKNINTVKMTVLSGVTQYIFLAAQMLFSKNPIGSFDGSQLIVKTGGYIITTVNYQRFSHFTHQHNLPDNLRSLFRVVAFQQPDISKICETRLFAAAFSNAKILANKIQCIYKFCIDQFLLEKKYDFGCHSLSAVLRNAINLKFAFPAIDEDTIILRSLIDINLPMFVNKDIIFFQKLLHDIFPNVCLPPPNYMSLLMTLDQVAKINGIQAHEVFKLKMIQILEMIHLRHIFILIGDSLSGKTTLIRTLAQCLSSPGQVDSGNPNNSTDIQLEIINQKSITSKILFGYLDEKTNRWNDGIYVALLRNYNERDGLNTGKKWIIFDGPVESTLMENLNIILDNNNHRIMLLPTGEKIDILNSISVILETDNIEEASPATVSRCGIIHLAQKTFDYNHCIAAWIFEQGFDEKYNKFMKLLIEWSINSCLNFVYKTCQFIIAVEKMYLVTSILKLCTIYIKSAGENTDEKDRNSFEIWYQAAVIQSIVWTFSACLSNDSCVLLNEYCISLWSNNDIINSMPKEIKPYEISLPNEGMIHDNMFVFKGTGFWKHWGEILKFESDIQTFALGYVFIPTIDTIKHIYMFNNHIKYRIPFIVCGDVSTGKTTLMQFFLNNKLPNVEYMINSFNFSSTTTVYQAQKLFLCKLSKVMKDRYAPMKNKYCINFIDDLDIGTNGNDSRNKSLLELIRQYVDHAYWYDLNEPVKLFINKVMFLCALKINGDDCQKILSSRFIRHFNLYTMCTSTRENTMKIFSNTLFHNLKKNSFTADVIGNVNSIVNATIEVYTSINNKFKPTPINIQYQFNIRDISKIIDGCSLIHKESAETKVKLIRLWIHESIRVFGDRMANRADSEFLFLSIKKAIAVHFKDTLESIFENLPKENNEFTQESLKNLIFANFMETDKDISTRRYEEVGSSQLLKKRIIYYLDELNNNSNKKLDILLLSDVLEHLVRICRILSIPSGNLLMICAGSLGRKSLTRLAAYIERQDFFQYTSNYYSDINAWRENLKCAIQLCSSKNKQCTFFISAKYIKDTCFDDINSLMTCGEIPHLLSLNERQTIVQSARLLAQHGDENIEISSVDVMAYFYSQCRKKLHFIFYFNLLNRETLQRQIQLFPNLLKFSTIDYFVAWPKETFIQVGIKFIENLRIENVEKEKIVIVSKYFYDESKDICMKYYNKYGRLTYITPSTYINMMQLYSLEMLNRQRAIMESKEKYLGGLKKLQSASKEVAQMQETLKALMPQLEYSAQKTEETMQEIESENISVENATIQVRKDEEIANKTVKIAATLKSECEADLAVAIPILEDAIAALNTLKPSDITLVKAMKNPPDTVKLVMAAVCVMLDVAAERVIDPISGRKYMDFWGPSKRVLGDMNFLQTLKDYDKDNISPTVMQIIKKTYMTDKNFMPHIVTKASSAAEGLCKWVRAMVSYDEVAKIVAPKKEKLAAAEKECNECLAFLNEKRKTLAALNDKLTTLKCSLQANLSKKYELETEVTICTEKLVKAEALILSLGDEKSKWLQTVDELKRSHDNLPGDILISCAIIVYLASFHSTYRNDNIALWVNYMKNQLDIPCSTNYNFHECLGSGMNISSLNQYELSKYHLSHENIAIMNNSMQYCLFIDPENQANMWIKEMERDNQLIIIKLTDSNYLQNLEQGIAFDRPVLVENINDDTYCALSIDCILLQIKKDWSDQWTHSKLQQYGENSNTNGPISNFLFPYKRQFRLYLTTNLHNPRFDQYIYSKITVIDCLLTQDALQNKLLDIVISREKPQLHEKFDRLLNHSAYNKQLLKQEEDKILTILSSSTINILQDDESMKILDNSKNLSTEILQKETCVNIAKREIDIFRKNYTEFTNYCATLYDTLSPLLNLNCMYGFSLEWFIQLYIKSIVESKKSVIIEKHSNYLKSSFTTILHSNVSIALSYKHRLVYSLLLCLKIQLHTHRVNWQDIEFFMSDNLNDMEVCDADMNLKPHWLPDDSWHKVILLSKNISTFSELKMSIKNDESLWMNFYNSINADFQTLPQQWSDSLTLFQRLLIYKIIRPDRTVIEISHYISIAMNGLFNFYSPQNLSNYFSRSSCLIPLIFILPCYIEPSQQIQEYAAQMGYASKLTILSLGENNKEHASELVLQAQKEGGWLLLENCHLMITWMLQLEKIYETINSQNTALEFRLWLSTAPTRLFPISILQKGIKIMCDTPLTLKESIMNCYCSHPLDKPDVFASCPGNDKILSKFIYAFTFFHIFMKERNYFGVHGWNVNYDFSHSDLTISISQLQTFIKSDNFTASMLLEGLYYLVGECNYGGKFIDEIDNKCLMTVFQDFCNIDIITQANYLFSTNFNIPDRCERHDYIKNIEKLPSYPPAELFGIGENSMINRNILAVNDFFYLISQLNGQANDNKLLVEDNIDTIDVNILKDNLPQQLNINRTQDFNVPDLLNELLIQEMELFDSVLKFIKKSLVQPDDNFIRALKVNTIPSFWYSHPMFSQHQKSLSIFIENINDRYEFFNKLINGECPVSYWLGIFACPKRFISVFRLILATHYKIPIDKFIYDFQVLSTKNPNMISCSNEKALYCHGLYLTGASWDIVSGNLIANNPRIFSELMPVIRMIPQLSEESPVYKQNNYLYPLYKSNIGRDLFNYAGNLSNFIVHVLLSSGNLQEDYWIKRGTSLYCQIE